MALSVSVISQMVLLKRDCDVITESTCGGCELTTESTCGGCDVTTESTCGGSAAAWEDESGSRKLTQSSPFMLGRDGVALFALTAHA